jgi:hypothetical protein
MKEQFPTVFNNGQFHLLYETLEEMLVHQTKLLKKLQQTFNSSNTVTGQSSYVGRSLKEYAPAMKFMADYTMYYETASKMLSKESNEDFLEFLDSTSKRGRCAVDFFSYLIMPCQRNMRYPMLISELIKHTGTKHDDHSILVDCLIDLKKGAQLQNDINVNELQRHHDLRRVLNLIGITAEHRDPTWEFVLDEQVCLIGENGTKFLNGVYQVDGNIDRQPTLASNSTATFPASGDRLNLPAASSKDSISESKNFEEKSSDESKKIDEDIKMKERNHRSVLSHSSSLSTNSTDKQSNGSTSSTLTNDTGSSRIIVLNSCVILVTVVVPNKEWLVLKRFPFDGK